MRYNAVFIDYAIIAYMPRSFNTIEAAARLRVSESTVRRLFLRHQLQGVKVGRALRFTEADILTFIERHREQVEPEHPTSIISPQAPKMSFTG
jgi:excisionase family DNA binding protein